MNNKVDDGHEGKGLDERVVRFFKSIQIDRAITCGMEAAAITNLEDRAKHVENFKKSIPTLLVADGDKNSNDGK